MRRIARGVLGLVLSIGLGVMGNQAGRADQPATAGEESLVKFTCYLSASKLSVNEPIDVLVVVKVQDGWHINSNPAKPDYVVATEFKVVSSEGTTLEKVTYPKPEEIQLDGFDEPQHVYSGEVAMFGKLKANPQSAGKIEQLEMQLHYQACNEEKCLPQGKLVFRGKVPIANVGEVVDVQNQKVFEKYRPKKPTPAESNP